MLSAGQITLYPAKSRQALPKIGSCLTISPNQQYGPSILLHGRGRFAVVTDVGSGMRWTRAGAVLLAPTNVSLRTVKACGSDTPMLVSSRSRGSLRTDDGGQKARCTRKSTL